MSADSPNRSQINNHHHPPKLRGSGGRAGGGAATVNPQQVTDPTILDSVAGFISDVVPTSYNIPYCEIDDQIQWARFEKLDSDTLESENFIPSALILILGYTTGIQIWAIPSSGEAVELLSWRHGTCRILKIIPNPYCIGNSKSADLFASARPLIAICDSLTNYSTLTFRSLKTSLIDPVKQIQFKNSITNVLANKRSVVVTFNEKIAVFDAFTLESRLTITTCYLSPGIQSNPVALGSRWLGYAEKKLIPSYRSGGGNEGEGVQSYTATVLHAAKSLGRGLRELTETVAGSLTGNQNFNKPGITPISNQQMSGVCNEIQQKGIITILDIENKNINIKENLQTSHEMFIAHFVAHTEAIVCLEFDPTGMLLLTADKRGHDFHLFRIQPHPGGSQLAAVHHLYILHRGDTSSKVQDMCFSPDSRWVTVSTLRGTTHVFPITPYGGNISVRTHATTHVVNKMSRYQRSAGLTSDGRSSSPVALIETPVSLLPYRNPRFPPYPQPTVVHPLAQIRQPVYVQQNSGLSGIQQRHHSGRIRLSSTSSSSSFSSSSSSSTNQVNETDAIILRIVCWFAHPRAWMMETSSTTMKTPRDNTIHHKQVVKPIESLFIMSSNGTLIQYDLDPLPSTSVAKEKICNDTSIELKVCAKAQWMLQRQPNNDDVSLPLSEEMLFLLNQDVPIYKLPKNEHNDDYWLSQVEIVTHLGPHRRLWMGPQFTFKTYTITNGSVVETRPIDVRRSKPVNMPVSKANAILIESGSANSCEQLFLDTYHKANEEIGSAGEMQLKEDLADAMLESPSVREGGHCVIVSMKPPLATHVNPLGTIVKLQSDEDDTEPSSETFEETVIHENCDETLFRPVVTSKAIFYSDYNKSATTKTTTTATTTLSPTSSVINKSPTTSNILTKTIEPNTQLLAIKINKNKDCISNSNTKINEYQQNNILQPSITTTTTATTKSFKHINNKEIEEVKSKNDNIKMKQFSDSLKIQSELPLININDDIKVELIKEKTKINSVDDIYLNTFGDKEIKSNVLSSSSSSSSTENLNKNDKIENKLIDVSNNQFMEEEKCLINVSSKNCRRPKAKLGKRISNLNKDNNKIGIFENDSSLLKTTTATELKLPWNTESTSSLLKLDEPVVEMVDFKFKVPNGPILFYKDNDKQCLPQDNIKINETDHKEKENINNTNLLKIDNKSSDDEKLDNSSSPTETTESSDDPSNKVKDISECGNQDDNQQIQDLPRIKSFSKKFWKRKRR